MWQICRQKGAEITRHVSDTTNEEMDKHFYLTAKAITANTKTSLDKMNREPEALQYFRILLV